MKCPACGASVSVTEDTKQFQCEYCKNTINIIKPVEIENKFVEGLTELQNQQFGNYVSILQQAMLAGNYFEAYNYCNKALEINPKAGGIWENKSICSFWLSSTKQFEEDKAIEIVTYLNASRQSDPNSPTFENTCKDIANNLYKVIVYLYQSFTYDNIIIGQAGATRISGYKPETLKQMLAYMRLLEVCYQIYPDTLFLKEYVTAITNGRGVNWIKYSNSKTREYMNTPEATYNNFDAAMKRYNLILKIRDIEPDYVPPEQAIRKSTKTRDLIIVAAVIVGFILMMVLCSVLGKN